MIRGGLSFLGEIIGEEKFARPALMTDKFYEKEGMHDDLTGSKRRKLLAIRGGMVFRIWNATY